MLGIARALPEGIEPHFVSMSEAHHLVRDFGYPSEYFPSSRKLGVGKGAWNERFLAWLVPRLTALEADGVVIDHVNPPPLFAELGRELPHIARVWVRRGLWKGGVNAAAVDSHHWFDLVIQPGDVAESFDPSARRLRLAGASHVAPVTLLDPIDLVDRAASHTALGLDAARPAVLLKLTDGDPDVLADMSAHAVAHLRSVLPDVQVFTPKHPLHDDRPHEDPAVVSVPVYPVARYLPGFEFCVSSAGYNSVHDAVMAHAPTIFVPHRQTGVDDQALRSSVLAAGGAAHHAATVDGSAFRSAIVDLASSGGQERCRAALAAVARPNGARQAAALIGSSI